MRAPHTRPPPRRRRTLLHLHVPAGAVLRELLGSPRSSPLQLQGPPRVKRRRVRAGGGSSVKRNCCRQLVGRTRRVPFLDRDQTKEAGTKGAPRRFHQLMFARRRLCPDTN